jgi:AraC-like DNA-binding protein
MRLLHEQVNISGINTIKVKRNNFSHFTFPWHYHKEFELLYVLKSYGKRYVGDSAEDFTDGDLVLLGSNLPHFWKSAPAYYDKNNNLRVNAIVVQFPNILSEMDSDKLPEFNNIRELFKRADRGVHFSKPAVSVIGSGLKNLPNLEGFERYIEFMKILQIMATTKHYRLLASPATKQIMPTGMDSRLERVLNYLTFNYTSEQNLNDLAQQISMNPSAFCRYFKEATGKTIVEYIHEMRVGYACKLLMERGKTISEIAFECGFNNISNFNRIFKKKIGHTPSNYQNNFGRF